MPTSSRTPPNAWHGPTPTGDRAAAVLEGNWIGFATRASAASTRTSGAGTRPARARLGPSTRSGPARAALAVRRPVARRPAPAHRLRRGRPLLPGARLLADGALARRARRPRTSGIVQPPLHATAALRGCAPRARPRRRVALLRELLPRLAAWHGYLHRERTRAGQRAGRDLAPVGVGDGQLAVWDAALARIGPRRRRSRLPAGRRRGRGRGRAAERRRLRPLRLPGAALRDRGLRPRTRSATTPFAVRSVLFNSLLVQADRDLAEISRVVGADPGPFEAWADRTAAGLTSLWDDAEATYFDFDVRAGTHIRARTGTGVSPLYAGVPSGDRVAQLRRGARTVRGRNRRRRPGRRERPSRRSALRPARYWRGPVWPMINWVVHAGLVRYGFVDRAAEIRAGLLQLARREGFWEHYDAVTGAGGGTRRCRGPPGWYSTCSTPNMTAKGAANERVERALCTNGPDGATKERKERCAGFDTQEEASLVSRPLSLSSRSPRWGRRCGNGGPSRRRQRRLPLNQLAQVSEIDQVRNTLLKGFDGNVDT